MGGRYALGSTRVIVDGCAGGGGLACIGMGSNGAPSIAISPVPHPEVDQRNDDEDG